jgi:PAS domain S-box-containing protein
MEKDKKNRNTFQPPELIAEESPDALECLDSTVTIERYQSFVENIQEGLYELDLQGKFQYFNGPLCKIFGYSRKELQSQHFSKFTDQEYAAKGFETFKRIYQTGQGVTDEIWKIDCKNGEIKIIELSANLIINSQGKKTGFRGIARDITEKFNAQEALKRSERRYRALLDLMPYPIVVSSADGLVTYLNPAFTEIFGWTLDELYGEKIPYVPPGLEEDTKENIEKLLEEKKILRHETQRLTKDGRVLDVTMRAAVYKSKEDNGIEEIVILRDITDVKKIERNNELLLRISLALPQYMNLEDLLDYVGTEIKNLLACEGAIVILLDEEKDELYFKAASIDNYVAETKMKEVRFPADIGISGEVIRTGKPIIVHDTYKDPRFYSVVDLKTDLKTVNMLDVPLKHKDRTIGVLCATNKKVGAFDQSDVELLSMIAGTVALSIENTKYAEELKDAYQEVSSLNRAKDKVINHLSHELRTPLSILGASLNILGKRLSHTPADTWQPTIERAKRNLKRILEMQYQVEDIMRDRHFETYNLLSLLLDECSDEIEVLLAEEIGERPVIGKIRERIDELFMQKVGPPQRIHLDNFVRDTLEEMKPGFSHRQLEVITSLNKTGVIEMPVEPLKKVVIGLIRNAVESTPDEGKIEISVAETNTGVKFSVRDYGIGIVPDHKRRIFEGFFTTQATMDYSSKNPFDFNAGGQGADLLRIRIFAERYNFQIHMTSSRCVFIPDEEDKCPGKISSCDHCKNKKDCHMSGGSTFDVVFPFASQEERPEKKVMAPPLS